MIYSINWTKRAKKSFDQNLAYLESEWNEQVIMVFLERVSEVLRNLESNSYLYPPHITQADTRKCIVHERIILYYRIFDTSNIDLLVFWNTYKKP